jgi:RecJ-like exonuclease
MTRKDPVIRMELPAGAFGQGVDEAVKTMKARAVAADLDRLVCEFCKAVGEPVPVDAIALARRQREEIHRLRAEPRCPTCNGTGSVIQTTIDGTNNDRCTNCDGSGRDTQIQASQVREWVRSLECHKDPEDRWMVRDFDRWLGE